MAQHDYDIANQSGSAFRADLNNALQAIVTNNSGPSAPSTTYAYQTWVDTSTTPVTIRRRNASNNGWVTVSNADGTFSTLGVVGEISSGTTGTNGSIVLRRASDGGVINSISFDSTTEEMRINNGSGNGKIAFQTVSIERARITEGGFLKASNTGAYTDNVGTSRAASANHFFRNNQNSPTVVSTSTSLGGSVEGFSSDLPTGATGFHFVGSVNLTRVFIVAANGNVTNTNNSYGAISDAKLKENIVDATSQWDDIKALQVRKYNLKEGQTHTQIGLVAQEVELVSPGLVSESPDRDAEGNDLGTVTKSVNYSVLYMKAVKALQEAMERIEALEAKVAALEAA